MKQILYLLTIILLFATITANCQSNSKENLSKVLHQPPTPYFFIKGLCFGDTTYFVNKSDMGTITWNITSDKGDTIFKASGETMAYYFKEKGTYKVSLTADNGHQATKSKTVIVDSVTKANFSFRYCYNEFDNESSCSDQFVWVLPDGTTSTDTFPAYKFSKPGKFPVKLIVINGNKKDTLTKTISVSGDSIGRPSAEFTYKLIGNPAIYEFKAVDSLAGYYSWYFGDDDYDDTTGYKVVHQFDIDKYHPPVSLMLVNGCGMAFFDVDPFFTTGIHQGGSSMEVFSIYPNPSNGLVTVNFFSSDKNEILITDVLGKHVFHEKVQEKAELNLSFLKKGIYFLKGVDKHLNVQVKRICID